MSSVVVVVGRGMSSAVPEVMMSMSGIDTYRARTVQMEQFQAYWTVLENFASNFENP
jgi:hypothetical protein